MLRQSVIGNRYPTAVKETAHVLPLAHATDGRGSERVQPTLVLRAWDADARTHASASILGAPNADDAAR